MPAALKMINVCGLISLRRQYWISSVFSHCYGGVELDLHRLPAGIKHKQGGEYRIQRRQFPGSRNCGETQSCFNIGSFTGGNIKAYSPCV